MDNEKYMKLADPVLEEEGMHVFEWWGSEFRPLEELIAEMAEIRANAADRRQ